MKIKALIKVLATWIGIALLVIAYLIDERSIIYFIAFIAFTAFSYFLYALYSGKLENHGRSNYEQPNGERPHPRPNR